MGGARSGKSVLLVRAIVARLYKAAMNGVSSRHAILRFRSSAVWPSIGMTTMPFVMKTFYPEITSWRPHVADKFFEFKINGVSSEIWLGGLDEKDRVDKILGNEYVTILFNECSQIPYPSVLVALSRLAQNIPMLTQRAYYDLNPTGLGHWSNTLFGDKRDPIVKKLLANPDDYVRAFINPMDNKRNLDPAYLQSLQDLPERARKRFLEGVYQEEVGNALWRQRLFEETRVARADVPQLQRVVVAVDPSGAASEMDATRDAIGIICVGLGIDGHCYVLDDATLLDGPEKWGKASIGQYYTWKANCIVGETNFGGAMVEYVIRSIDPSVPFREVKASRSKVVRAEPAATLYSRGRVHHVGDFPELETELCDFTDVGYGGARSPNRADALVWALHELVLKEEDASGWVSYYANKVKSAGITSEVARAPLDERQKLLGQLAPPTEVELRTTPGASFYVSGDQGTSRMFTASGVGVITAPIAFEAALRKAGCM